MVHYEFDDYYNDRANDDDVRGATGGMGYDGLSISELERQSYSYLQNDWSSIAETTLPLKASKFAAANHAQFQQSVEMHSRQISSKVIRINLISLVINLVLAVIAFYFSFVNNSPSTTAFATDCILDFVSSGIVLWRYYGDLNSVYTHAREQIACIYLGALFEISGLAIIIKAVSDISGGSDDDFDPGSVGSYELVYLASAATFACVIITVFKCSLYNTLKDESILLDVINTLISTVFAISIIMSQVLINVNPTFWYLDPILSIVLALFMMVFGLKVIHQNLDILRPMSSSNERSNGAQDSMIVPILHFDAKKPKGKFVNDDRKKQNTNEGLPLGLSQQASGNWQRTTYSTIRFE